MPYWRLSGFYFFYFATLGVLMPYWGLYLRSEGFGARDIGSLMALFMVSRMIAPVAWGWLADHRDRRMAAVRLAALLTLVAFSAVFFRTGFWWLAAVMFLFSFFWNASLPLLEVATMNHFGSDPGAYGRVRLWGSIGFIASVLVLGVVIDHFGPRSILPALLILMLGVWFYSMTLPETEVSGHIDHAGSFRKAIMRPEVFAFLLACFLMQVSHGPYYAFYSIYLEGHGYSSSLIGFLWAFAVMCEIAVFLVMRRLLTQVSLRPVLLASFLLAAVRWLLIGYFPDHLGLLVLAQTLHAATFGAFHATAMQLIYRFFTGRHQHRGQAIYGGASFGLGGAVGSFYSGQTWGSLGPAPTFAIAAGAAGLAFLVALVALKPKALP
ncbi:MAG: MFS transporter [Acidiferrobacterales bacterium]